MEYGRLLEEETYLVVAQQLKVGQEEVPQSYLGSVQGQREAQKYEYQQKRNGGREVEDPARRTDRLPEGEVHQDPGNEGAGD